MCVKLFAAFLFVCFGVLADSTTIAESIPLSAEEQQEKFKLPPGFEIQLVVSDPLIGQPMNLNFDARGRLWITHSIEYPFPAKGDLDPRGRFKTVSSHDPRDVITIVGKIGGDGKGSEVSNFTDGLNIPIGHVPLNGGKESLVYSIPNIYHAIDKDGDGKADEKKLLYGRFGNIDTHGMASSFTRWVDGWIYGTHGFANTSKVKDASGNITEMNSGNTYRFKEDGSVFEQFTWGMVNPFGMTFDKWGNQYVSDCHSKPLYMMLRGAYYPSFGKPHDGLGYAPQMLKHSHGSTGICGPAFYEAEHFPKEFQGNVFICNPVNGKVNRDTLTQTGSTLIANEQPDFITCEDPWFRPVDAIVGPDGALYIADFYNAIIGHYEVPLTHEKRDRNKGRIWRIVYKGEEKTKPLATKTDLFGLDLNGLAEKLNSEILNVRVLATNHIVDSFGKTSAEKMNSLLENGTEYQKAHALWVLERTVALSETQILKLMNASEDLVRTHILKLVAERKSITPKLHKQAVQMLQDKNPFARRAAADVLGQHPAVENVKALISAMDKVDGQDSHFHHVAKISLRNQFLNEKLINELNGLELSQNENSRIAEIMLAVKSDGAANYLLTQLTKVGKSPLLFKRYVSHIIRYSQKDNQKALAKMIRSNFADDRDSQSELLKQIYKGLQQKGAPLSSEVREWALALAKGMIGSESDAVNWSGEKGDVFASNWSFGKRSKSTGAEIQLISSFPKGEKNTGFLKSEPFDLPQKLEFFIAGHSGMKNDSGQNKILLKDLNGKILKQAGTPGNDVAQKVTWIFENHGSQKVYLEVVDEASAPGYAWIAVGEFSPAKLNIDSNPELQTSLNLISSMKLKELSSDVLQIIKLSKGKNISALKTYAALENDSRVNALVGYLASNGSLTESAEKVAKPDLNVFIEICSSSTKKQLLDMVDALANDSKGVEILLALAEKKKLPAIMLNSPQVIEKIKQRGEAPSNRLKMLLSQIKSGSGQLMADIKKRHDSFKKAKVDLNKGKTLFNTYCFACHSISGKGGNVGPNLDGVGSRGFERIAEDILDPNLNVDPVFLTSTITLKDGRTLIGMLREPQGNTEVMVDVTGKETLIPKGDIKEKKTGEISPMPAAFGQLLNDKDFADLMGYLLSTKQK